MLKAIDLFCGAGGLALGLRQAGFSLVASLDDDPCAAKTYRANLGTHIIETGIDKISPDHLLEFAGLRGNDCDLLAGGPPCQGFSVQRRGDDNDQRNSLVLKFIRFVEVIRPRFFLIENVRGLMSKRGRPFFEQLMSRAQMAGYRLSVSKLNAVDYGVPQERIRVFMVGQLIDNACFVPFQFPPPSHRAENYRTVRSAIGDLPRPPDDGSPHPRFPLHYRETRLSKTNLERFRHIPEGGGRDDLPEHLQLRCHTDNPSHRHKDVYGRMWWDRPAPTLTARFDSFSRGRFGHPEDDRTITLREGARLQTFPDDFHFYGNREAVARQIGNAVPPRLAEVIGEAIADCLKPSHQAKKTRFDGAEGQLPLPGLG